MPAPALWARSFSGRSAGDMNRAIGNPMLKVHGQPSPSSTHCRRSECRLTVDTECRFRRDSAIARNASPND